MKVKAYMTLFLVCTLSAAAGCTGPAEAPASGNPGSISLLNDLNGLSWGMSIDEACAVLDESFEYEQITDDSDSNFITINILNSTEYNGMSVQKLLRFNDLGIEGTDGQVLTSISYTFDSYEEIYTYLTSTLGEPDGTAEQNENLVCWNGSSLSELYPEDTIRAMYESRDKVGLSQNISLDVYSGYAAETLMLYNIDGQGYLSDDGSYIALAESLQTDR